MKPLKRIFDVFFTFIFLKLYKGIDRIESALAYSDLQFLFLAGRDGYGKGAIVEIGSYKGKSTLALAFGAKLSNREKVFSIDPHFEGTKEIFFNNLVKMGLSNYVIPRLITSEEARKSFDLKIRLLFIDGNHEYEFVKKDILLWKDLMIEGGIIVFHDYNWQGVRKAVAEFIINSDEFIVEGTTGCSIFASKYITKNKDLFDAIHKFNKVKDFLRPWKNKSLDCFHQI